MEGGDLPTLLPLWGYSCPDSGLQPPLDLPAQLGPLPIPLLGQTHNRRVGLVHLSVAVLLPDLPAMELLVSFHSPALECLELLLVAHDLLPFLGSNGVLYRLDELFQPPPLRHQGGQVAP